jgi:amidase
MEESGARKKGGSTLMDEQNVFIRRLSSGGRIRVAIKDAIDLAGVATTAGSKVVADISTPATENAECLKGCVESGACFVGKTSMSELAFSTGGVNTWCGTARNPFGVDLVPGGSSSGSAAAVAYDLCDWAAGTDTGGSVRIPAACCGVIGLKTSYGSISLKGVWPLAPSFDTVGPIAKSFEGLRLGVEMLGFDGRDSWPLRGITALNAGSVQPVVAAAFGAAIRRADMNVSQCDVSEGEWNKAGECATRILWGEAAQSNLWLRDRWPELQVGWKLVRGLEYLSETRKMDEAYAWMNHWKDRLSEIVEREGFIVSPGLESLAPRIAEYLAGSANLARFTSPVNLAGLPAIAFPIPSEGFMPASLQIVGPLGSDLSLISLAEVISRRAWRVPSNR